MIRIFLFGINGKMGRFVCDQAEKSDDFVVVGGFDRVPHPTIRTYADIKEVPGDFDVVIDFSRAELLPSIIALCEKYGKPVVIASTGYSDEQLADIAKLAEKVAVLRSGNMSLGVNLLLDLVEKATRTLGYSFDAEIIEKHHNQKADAPSGTALMLAEKIKEVRPDTEFVYGRHGASKREPNDVTIHAVRGGTIVGEHDVIFAGEDEIITLSHVALSRKIFAVGALKAAAFIVTKQNGLYSMKNVLD